MDWFPADGFDLDEHRPEGGAAVSFVGDRHDFGIAAPDAEVPRHGLQGVAVGAIRHGAFVADGDFPQKLLLSDLCSLTAAS